MGGGEQPALGYQLFILRFPFCCNVRDQLVRWGNQVQRDRGDLLDHVDSKVKEEHLDLQ